MNKYLLTTFALTCTLGGWAQVKQTLTPTHYANAERFMGYNTEPLVDHGRVNPNWLGGDKFWFRDMTAQGSEFIWVDAAKGTRRPVFDHEQLAKALATATGKSYQAGKLPFQTISFSPDESAVIFRADGRQWRYQIKDGALNADTTQVQPNRTGLGGRRRAGNTGEVLSPDGKRAAYIKENNLWVREIQTGKQTQLTTDGLKDYGYATDNAGWKHSDAAILRWSPDSRKIATFKQDQRKVGEMYLVSTNVGHPQLEAWKYPLPGDENIAMIERVIIDVDNAKVIPLQIPADPHRATLSDDISSSGTFDDVDWSTDASQLAFVSTSRDHRQEKVRIADATTGTVREIFEEVVPTQYESGWDAINWRYLSKSKEIIWFSERSNWGHLYLYNAATGKLKNQITKGNFVVTQLLKVDEKNRLLYFMANGLQKENPYFSQLCRIRFDGKQLTVITPEAGNHQVILSPSQQYLLDSYSKPDVPAVTVMRNLAGKLLATVQKTDVTRLAATGWKPLTPFTVKAHDGKTDIYGIMFTPTQLDPNKKYPVIDYIYPGPQGGSVGSWSFSASRGDNQALAELGFIVIALEGTSNPLRSKSFHDMSYGNMAENTLPDQITGIRQLASRYKYIDTTRIGIWGHSGGGFATAAAMFRYPDFFKVGISESGNHENRNYEDDWSERYNGLISTSELDKQANQTYAKNLKGKLMLAHGLMDDNVPPQNTFLVIEALEKANKDYDLVVFPNSAHGYGPYSYYMMRRRWDYFVQHLLGAEPPKEYQLKPQADPRNTSR